jgi:tol-pal system protein YbgF
MKLKIVLPWLAGICVWSQVYAESRALPPVIGSSTYPAQQRSDKPSASNSIYETLGRIEQLQVEVQQLRGEVEEQAYTILQLKTRIKDIYTDFDHRLEQLEAGSSTSNVAVDSVQQLQDQQLSAQKAPLPVNPQPKVSEKQKYQKAYETLRNGHNNQAIQLFNQLLQDFPGGQYAANAYFWLGEAYKVNKNTDAARQAFNKVIADYPNSQKVADAMLKLGILELEKNNQAIARDLLTGVTIRFPGSTAAHLAAKKLRQLK